MKINSSLSFKGTYFDQNYDLKHTTPQEDEQNLINIITKAQSVPADRIEISLDNNKNIQMVIKEEQNNPLTFVLMGCGLLIKDTLRTINIDYEELTPKAERVFQRLKDLLECSAPKIFAIYEADKSRNSELAFQLEDALNRTTIDQAKKALKVKEHQE